MKGVTGTKTVSRNRKELYMHVYYTGAETDDFLMSLEDAFYSNRRFKGYTLIPSQSGEVIVLYMEME